MARIGPNQRPNWVLAALVGALALGMAGLGGQLALLLRAEWGLLLIPFGIAAALGLLAVRLATRPFGATAALTLGDDSIQVERWGMFGSKPALTLKWADIAALQLVAAPYTRLFGVELKPEAAIALGLRPETFKTKGVIWPGPLVIWCHANGFEVEIDAVFAALKDHLAQAGYKLGAQNEGRALPVGKRWAVLSAACP